MANERQSNDNADQSKSGSGGNFANDPQRASEAGKKGGQHSQGGSSEKSGGSTGSNKSGSGRSQQGSVQSDGRNDARGSDKESGSNKNRR